jgi:hypothetical protein
VPSSGLRVEAVPTLPFGGFGFIPGPPCLQRQGRLDGANDGLAAFMDHQTLNADHLLLASPSRGRAADVRVGAVLRVCARA